MIFGLYEQSVSIDPKNSRVYPLVSVVVEENVSDECLASIQHSDYHKYEIVFFGERARSKYILSIQHNVLLAPTSISRGVATLMDLPKWEYVEIRPVLRRPQKITELFRLYHIVALAPFISLRVTLKIPPNHNQPWLTLRRANIPVRRARSRLYGFTRWLILMVNAEAHIIHYCHCLCRGTAPLPSNIPHHITTMAHRVCHRISSFFTATKNIVYLPITSRVFGISSCMHSMHHSYQFFVQRLIGLRPLLWRAHRQTIA